MSVLVGDPMARTDGARKVSGEAEYGVDHRDVGMLHGVILRSPMPAGRIRKLDVDQALQMPGVHAVLSAADQPNSRGGWVLQDQTMFATGEVRYEGEPVALVVADTREQAVDAVAAIVLDLEPLTGITLDRAGDDGQREIHPEWKTFVPTFGVDHPRGGNIAAEMRAEPEGVDEAFERADQVVEDFFRVGRQYQGYLEPKSATARYVDGRYEIHSANQYPFNVRERVAQLLDVRLSDVRLIGKTIGGGFGGKLDASVEPIAALAAKHTRRPVQIRNERTEDILSSTSRENATMVIRTALDADGRMIARDFSCEMDNGAYSGEMPWLASLPLSIVGSVYKIHGPARVISRLWYTNTAPTGAFRGVGGAYLYLALERHTDRIANLLGVDRREYRLRHLFADGDTTRTGQVLEQASILREAFDLLEGHAPWAELVAGLKPNQGIGIASAVWMTNPLPSEVTVKMHEDGTVSLITAANDNGSGAVFMGLTQIVADTLGVAGSDVRASMPDTDASGYDGGSQGARTTAIAGTSAVKAARQVREQLLDVAAGMLEADVSDLELTNGHVVVKGSPDSKVPVAAVAATATFTRGPISASASYATAPVPFDAGCASGALFTTMSTPTYHVHLAVVEVDPVTGAVQVVRYIVVQECGKVINPVGVRGQIQGGVAQGIGYSLYESLRIDDDARMVERSLESYRLPLALDVPDVEIITMEHPDPATVHGAKGVAEAPLVLAPAVIANAVSHAIGCDFSSLPITPEDVLFALDDMENGVPQ